MCCVPRLAPPRPAAPRFLGAEDWAEFQEVDLAAGLVSWSSTKKGSETNGFMSPSLQETPSRPSATAPTARRTRTGLLQPPL